MKESIMKYRKVVLVLGGSGFIGSHVVDCLLSYNFKVINIDLNSRCLNNSNYFESVLDVLDPNSNVLFVDVLKTYKPAIIFNLISTMSIKKCNDCASQAVKNNILSNISILETIKIHNHLYHTSKVDLFVYASSVYAGNNKSGVYGITKRASEDFIKYYCGNCDLNYLLLRYGTVYGPRSTEENTIHKIIVAALKTKRISLYGTGEETREYVNVKDAANMSVSLIKQSLENDRYLFDAYKISNQSYFIGVSNSIKASSLASLLKDILGPEYSIEFRDEKSVGHYNITPYQYENVPIKYNCDFERDLGAGLLETINYLTKEKFDEK